MSDIRKKAWPGVIGTPEYEAGSMSPTGDPVTDMIQDTSEPYDGLTPEKSVLEDQVPATNYEGGIVSPVDGYDWSSYWPDDLEDEKVAFITVYDGISKLATFSCQIAETLQEKTIGLQNCSGLNKSSGMIFKYSRPSDVMYHMGTVSFPIDIIFIDESNIIKKIESSINPGTIGIYGCSEVSHVLEVSGGLSELIGIEVGHHVAISNNNNFYKESRDISKECGYQKDPIIKYASKFGSEARIYNDTPIINIKSDSNAKVVSDLISQMHISSNKTCGLYIDNIIANNPYVKVFDTVMANDDNKDGFKISASLSGVYINNNGKNIDITKDSKIDKSSIVLGRNESLGEFLSRIYSKDTDIYKILSELNNEKRAGSNIVFVTKFAENASLIKDLISIKGEYILNKSFSLNDASTLIINSNNIDSEGIISAISDKKGTADIKLLSDIYMLKTSGTPVANSTKEVAKRAYKLLERAYELIEDSCNNLDDNMAEYEKIQDNFDAIKSTKGQYHQSMKRNSRTIKAYLIKLRDAIRLLNTIKDISTTIEIIDNLVIASKTSSDTAEEVFSVIDKLDNMDFFQELSKRTSAYNSACSDLRLSIEGTKEYINSNILGMMVLSS